MGQPLSLAARFTCSLVQIIATLSPVLSLLLKSNDVIVSLSCDVLRRMYFLYRTIQRFMVVTETEFLLVDPDKKKLGWGVVHFIAFLQVTTAPNV